MYYDLIVCAHVVKGFEFGKRVPAPLVSICPLPAKLWQPMQGEASKASTTSGTQWPRHVCCNAAWLPHKHVQTTWSQPSEASLDYNMDFGDLWSKQVHMCHVLCWAFVIGIYHNVVLKPLIYFCSWTKQEYKHDNNNYYYYYYLEPNSKIMNARKCKIIISLE